MAPRRRFTPPRLRRRPPVYRSRLVVPALLLAACVPTPHERMRAAALPAPVTPAPAGPDVPLLAEVPAPVPEDPTLLDLAVPGHKPAVVSIPPGATSRRPVLVATHGAGGTPEAHCSYWQALVGETAFVLCPRGVTMDVHAPPAERGYFYPAHPALGREVRAALDALAARFPDRIDAEGAIYAGYSQGATMGALVFGSDPAPFTAAVLIEGGVEEWTTRSARAFKERGGRRVVFACGRRSCADAARRSAGVLERAGVESRVVDATGAGHTYGGAVREGVTAALPFVFGGDGRWR